ncbi:MAG TPA: hypothetical protein VHC00_13600 [Rhizobiaceae bacterium]|nr:hypothetical protein [Rhizobiaceae bacterium]
MNLVACLQSFNRKERYWVIRNILDYPDGMEISDSFLNVLNKGFDCEFERNSWWAIDYHIDWLIGALALYGNGGDPGPIICDNVNRLVRGSQEDFDFIVAAGNTIVVIEAKFESPWTPKQYKSKVSRFKQIKSYFKELCPDVKLDFGLMARRERNGVIVPQIELQGPPTKWFRRIKRWDPISGKPSKDGSHWHISGVDLGRSGG